jgi:hypothetical protein
MGEGKGEGDSSALLPLSPQSSPAGGEEVIFYVIPIFKHKCSKRFYPEF